MNLGFEWLDAHERGSCLILADQQTAGRGTRGRSWQTLEENISVSLAFWIPLKSPAISQLSFVAAIALGETLSALTPGLDMGYKWPNDLLVQGQKMAGILIETTRRSRGQQVVLGMGVNLKESPNLEGYVTTSLLEETGCLVTRESFIDAWVPQFDRFKDLWLKEGFSAISKIWHEKALYLGENIRILARQNTIEGVFQGLDGEGCLVLKVSTGNLKSFRTVDKIERVI